MRWLAMRKLSALSILFLLAASIAGCSPDQMLSDLTGFPGHNGPKEAPDWIKQSYSFQPPDGTTGISIDATISVSFVGARYNDKVASIPPLIICKSTGFKVGELKQLQSNPMKWEAGNFHFQPNTKYAVVLSSPAEIWSFGSYFTTGGN
jgi:hypothetical protein